MAHVQLKEFPVEGKDKPRRVWAARWKENGKQKEKGFKLERDAKAHAAAMQLKFEETPLAPIEEKQLRRVMFEDLAKDYLIKRPVRRPVTKRGKGYCGGSCTRKTERVE